MSTFLHTPLSTEVPTGPPPRLGPVPDIPRTCLAGNHMRFEITGGTWFKKELYSILSCPDCHARWFWKVEVEPDGA